MAICLSREVSSNLHEKRWGGRQMFLIFFKLFSTFFYVLLQKKSIYIPIMYSNLPQRLESQWKFLPVYLLPIFQFHELDSLWINLHSLKMNYSDMHFSALQSWTATLHSPRANSHNPGAEQLGCKDTLLRWYPAVQNQFIHKWEEAHNKSSLTLLLRPHQNSRKTVESLLHRKVLAVLFFSIH